MIFYYVASIIYFRKNNVIRMFLWLRSVKTKNKTSQLLHVKMYKKHISQILSTSVFLSFSFKL